MGDVISMPTPDDAADIASASAALADPSARVTLDELKSDLEPNSTTTELPILSGLADGQDAQVALNLRDWLQGAVEAKGARMTGGGVGCGGSDIDIELEGCHYNIFIKPIVR